MDGHRILFAGTPEIAVPLLREISKRFNVVGVLTSCDKSVGRSGKLVPSPVKAAAVEIGLPVLQFDSIRTPAREAVKALGPDTLLTFAFGRIFGPLFLKLFSGGCFNVHPSALPQFRGPSPIQFTIENGLENATISLQTLGLEMDQGDVWGASSFRLDGTETTQTLTERIANEAAAFVPDLLEEVFSKSVIAKPQVGEASYCTMIDREFGHLDFRRTVKENHCKIRSCYPWPKAWARVNGSDIFVTGVWGGFKELERVESMNNGLEVGDAGKIVEFRKDRGIGVQCSDGVLWITRLQLPAKKELDFKAFVNGNRWILTSRFE